MVERGGRAVTFGLYDPPIAHVDPERDSDHYPRVAPGKMRGRWAACQECPGAVRAYWTGPHLNRLVVGMPASADDPRDEREAETAALRASRRRPSRRKEG